MFVLLSHRLGVDTPAFAGGPSLTISPIKQMDKGGSSNSYRLAFPNHLGTHIDAPQHFDPSGKPLSAYDLEDFVFTHPVLLDIPKDNSMLIF
ncbi:MAG: cyclase family protein, partial [Candidatus Geothermarchaeales archaeon]